jgi:hypothetical protein
MNTANLTANFTANYLPHTLISGLGEIMLLAVTFILIGTLISIVITPVTKEKRKAASAFNALVYQLWQAQSDYLKLKEVAHLPGSIAGIKAYDLERQLLTHLTAAQEHREIARAWLGIGKIGYLSVYQQSHRGLAALAKFRACNYTTRRRN